MTGWEYRLESIVEEDELKQLGAAGWELISGKRVIMKSQQGDGDFLDEPVVQDAIFKRPLDPTRSTP